EKLVNIGWFPAGLAIKGHTIGIRWQHLHQAAKARETGRVIRLAKVNRAAHRCVHGGAPQFFMAGALADGRLYEGPPRQVQTASFGHEQLVAKDGKIASAGHTVADNGRELWYAFGRNHRVVAEDAPEVVFIGKDLVLKRQENAGAIDQVDEGQAVI